MSLIPQLSSCPSFFFRLLAVLHHSLLNLFRFARGSQFIQWELFLGILLSSWPHQSLGSSPPQSLAGAQGVTLFLIFFFKVTSLNSCFQSLGSSPPQSLNLFRLARGSQFIQWELFLGILLSSWPHQSLGSSPPQSLAGAQGVTLFLIFFFKVTSLNSCFQSLGSSPPQSLRG